MRGDERSPRVQHGHAEGRRAGRAPRGPARRRRATAGRRGGRARRRRGRGASSACAGVSTAPRRVFVGVTRWATTAKVHIAGMVDEAGPRRGRACDQADAGTFPHRNSCVPYRRDYRVSLCTVSLHAGVYLGAGAVRPGARSGEPPGRTVTRVTILMPTMTWWTRSLERELKLEPPEGFELPELEGRGARVAVLHLDVLRHAAALARACRDHAAPPGRERRVAVAAEAAAGGERARRDRGARRPRRAAGRAAGAPDGAPAPRGARAGRDAADPARRRPRRGQRPQHRRRDARRRRGAGRPPHRRSLRRARGRAGGRRRPATWSGSRAS